MSTPQVAISQDFFTAFARVSRGKQKKVEEFVSKFRANPQSSGINFEKINDAANDRYRSVRIDQEIRGIVYHPPKGNVYLLLWVDKHDDAYAWARRHQCEVNPQTGVLQLYETVHTEGPADSEPAAVSTEDPPEPSGPLFDLRERELLRLGVPSSQVTLVRSLTSVNQLDRLERRLPVEAFEALAFLAEDVPLDEVMAEYAVADDHGVDTDDLASALQRDSTQRRFHIVEDDGELQAMLNAPLEQWRVFLHPDQRRLVERNWNGPVRVLGGAGTGKTVVVMHRARWLVRNVLANDEKLLLTTFTRNLALDIQANLRKICSSEELKRIDVVNIDAWVHRYLKSSGEGVRIVYPGQPSYDKAWDQALTLADASLDLPDSFFQEEWQKVVLPQRVQTRQDYLRASRLGRGVPLNRKQRAAIWPVFEEMRLQLHRQGVLTQEDAVFQVSDSIDEGKAVSPYRAALVDEAQDFGLETLGMIRKLVPEQADDLMIVGDGHQRIYGRKASLSKAGINIRGRGKKLRVNYRTTEQIRRFATAVLEGVEVDDLDEGEDQLRGYRSLMSGQDPVLKGFDSTKEEADWVVQEIQSLTADADLTLPDICIVARTRTQLNSVQKTLEAQGVDHRHVERNEADDNSKPGVRMATMHRVKGLEFRVVFLVGIKDGVVPLKSSINSTSDPVERRNRELNDRALLHVAGTRAARALYITWNGEPSEYLPAMKI